MHGEVVYEIERSRAQKDKTEQNTLWGELERSSEYPFEKSQLPMYNDR